MTNLRFEAVTQASRKRPVEVITPVQRPSEFFGRKVFNRARMYKYLPADVYEKLVDVIDNGVQLDRGIANAVAKGMKQWADENGVTHYSLVPTSDRGHCRETRCLCRARWKRRYDRGIFGQTAGSTRA